MPARSVIDCVSPILEPRIAGVETQKKQRKCRAGFKSAHRRDTRKVTNRIEAPRPGNLHSHPRLAGSHRLPDTEPPRAQLPSEG